MGSALHEQFEPKKDLSPRVKLAHRLYATGAVRTKKEAAEAAGIHPGYMYMLADSQKARSFVQELDEQLESKTVDMSRLLSVLGRRAVRNIAQLMESSSSEAIQLKAAQDLADRSQETQKTQRLQVEQFSISGEDAKELAKLLVEASRTKEDYSHVVEGDFVKVDLTKEVAVAEASYEATGKVLALQGEPPEQGTERAIRAGAPFGGSTNQESKEG